MLLKSRFVFQRLPRVWRQRYTPVLFLLCGCLCGLCFGAYGAALAQGTRPRPSDYAVKAAYLYNFLKLAHFNPSALRPSARDGSRVACLYVTDPQFEYFSALHKKPLLDGMVIVRRVSSSKLPPNCDALFISREFAAFKNGILEQARTRGILTLGESDTFQARGGILHFFMQEGSVRFSLNHERAEEEGIAINKRVRLVAIPTPSALGDVAK